MAPRAPVRTLATVMFTDIVGSTELASALEDRRWHELLARHHRIVRRNLKRFSGREVGIEIRAGLHTGKVEVARSGVRGVAVHLGARVMSVASAGEVMVSSTTRDLIAGSGVQLADHGVHRLKGIDGEWHLFEVTSVDGEPLAPPLEPAEAERRRTAVERPSSGRRSRRRCSGAGRRWDEPGGRASAGERGRRRRRRDRCARGGRPGRRRSDRWRETEDRVRRRRRVGALDERLQARPGVVRRARGPTRRRADSRHLTVRGHRWETIWVPGNLGTGITIGSPRLFRLDPGSAKELSAIRLPHEGVPTDVAFGADVVWVSFSDGELERVDPATAKVDLHVHLEGGIDAVAADADGVWTLNALAGTVSGIDPQTGDVLATAPVSSNARYLAAGEGASGSSTRSPRR